MTWQKRFTQLGRFSLGGLLLGAAMVLNPLPAAAQACALNNPVAPSEANRRFQSDRLNLAFSLPANYRAMLRRTGHITLHDPASFDFLQCLARAGRYGQVPSHVTVEIAPIGNGSSDDLTRLVRHKRPWIDYYNPTFSPITFAGQPALEYRYIQDIYGLEITNISFVLTDGATLVTVTGPTRDAVLQTVVTSFELISDARETDAEFFTPDSQP